MVFFYWKHFWKKYPSCIYKGCAPQGIWQSSLDCKNMSWRQTENSTSSCSYKHPQLICRCKSNSFDEFLITTEKLIQKVPQPPSNLSFRENKDFHIILNTRRQTLSVRVHPQRVVGTHRISTVALRNTPEINNNMDATLGTPILPV